MLSCQRLQANAYRVLGVSAASTWPQIQNAAAALRRAAILNMGAPAVDCFGEITRSEATIRAALGALKNPSERIQQRLFWFHGPFCLQPDQCAGPWPPLDVSEVAHENALGTLVAAYASEDLPQVIGALRAWHDFLKRPDYWEALAKCETQANFEPNADAAEIEDLREHAMEFAAEPLTAAAREAWAQKAEPRFRDCLAAFRQLEETGAWAAAVQEDLLRLQEAATRVQTKQQEQAEATREEPAPPSPFGQRAYKHTDPFPPMQPIFGSNGWRAATAFIVSGILGTACLSFPVVSSAWTHKATVTQRPLPVPAKLPLPPPMDPQGGDSVDDDPAPKLRELDAQIQREERSAQQMKRQLTPLKQEIETMRLSLAGESLSASVALQEKVEIYQHLQDQYRELLEQLNQHVHARDRLAAGETAVEAANPPEQNQ